MVGPEPEPLERRAEVLANYFARYVQGYAAHGVRIDFLEAFNDFDFLITPIWRFAANWPFRIGNWFTDPLRGGVPIEVFFVALVALWAYRKADNYRRARAAVTARAS